MITRIFCPLVAASVLLAFAVFSQQSNKAENLYQEALMQMEGRGNYTKALELFGQIMKNYPGNRQLSAKSQFQIGVCYERLGKTEAQKAYERVIKDFADQREVVAEARGRLRALESASQSRIVQALHVRQVWTGPDVDNLGAPSPDGDMLSFVDWETGDLAVRNLETAEKRRVTNKGSWEKSGEFALFSIFSPDGKWLAYNWYGNDNSCDLRLIASDGSGGRIVRRDDKSLYMEPLDWSSDGKRILIVSTDMEYNYQLAFVSVEDGSVHTVKQLGWLNTWKAYFSPDAKYIAYEFPQHEGAPERDIFLLAAEGSREFLLVKHPADDYLVGWAPDGKRILFGSDRTGTWDIWAVQVSDTGAQGPPELIKTDAGSVYPMGITKKGTLYYSVNTGLEELYLAKIDFSRGTLLAPPEKIIRRFTSGCFSPTFSPDGNHIAYVSEVGPWSRQSGVRVLCIRSLKTGEERETLPKLTSINRLTWSPDGRYILLTALDKKNQQGLYRVDVQTNEVTLVRQKQPEEYLTGRTWAVDSKGIYFTVAESKKKIFRLMMREIETGIEHELYRQEAPSDDFSPRFLSLSPEGTYVACSTKDSKTKSSYLRIIPTQGGESRILVTLELQATIVPLGWSSGGREILYSTLSGNPQQQTREVYRIALDGGKPQKLTFPLATISINDLCLHPDGQTVAFTAGKQKSEIWVMENFLPRAPETSIGLNLRRLEYPELNTPFARLSPDGKKMAYVVFVGGNPKRIDILDLGTGTTKVFVDSGAGGQSSLAWSPHSGKIVYTFQGRELRVRDIEGEGSRVLLKKSQYQVYPCDWSRDEKKILCFFQGEDWTTQIGTITTEGHVQFLVAGRSSDFRSEPKFSPDGKYVSCSLSERAGNADIYVWAADGSRKLRVTEHPGRDENPVWSPDGKYLVYVSDRNLSVDLWAVRMQDGATVGSPFVVKRDLGWRTRIHDFAASGKLFMLVLGGAEPSNLFQVPVDQAQMGLRAPIAPITLYPTDHVFPRYSPNGKMVAYLSRKGQIGLPKLFVLDEKGSEKELPLQGHYAVNLAWHPENRSVFFAGWDKEYTAGVYEISLGKEQIRTVYSGETVDLKTLRGALMNINLLPDAKKMMFFKGLGLGDVEVHTYDPAGQRHAVVLPRVKMPIWGSPSPTGEDICYRIGDSLMIVSVFKGTSKLIGSSTPNLEATWVPKGESLAFREESALRVFSLKDSTTRTLYQAPAGRTIGGMEMYGMIWSPNGDYVIFTERDTSASSVLPQQLFLMRARDGSLKTLGEAPAGYRLSSLQWSSDGSNVLASADSRSGARVPMYEYWVMENFLPKEER